jgi:hypothetical protein
MALRHSAWDCVVSDADCVFMLSRVAGAPELHPNSEQTATSEAMATALAMTA